jgi:hypothetical protein
MANGMGMGGNAELGKAEIEKLKCRVWRIEWMR